MTSRERVLAALVGKIPDRVPWIENYVSNEVAAALIGHKDFLHATYSQKIERPGMIRVPPAIRKVIPLDNISYDMAPPRFAETERIGGLDQITKGLIKSKNDLKLMDTLPDPDDESLYNPIEDFLRHYKEDSAAIATVRSGVSNTYLSMGIEHFCLSIAQDPGLVKECLERFSDWTRRVVINLQELPFDLFFVPDDLGFGKSSLISPKHFREFCLTPMKKVFDAMKIPAVYHSDGNFLPLLEDIIRLGIVGAGNFEPGPMDIVQVKRKYGDRITIIGNIDLHYTLTRGTHKETKEEVKRRIQVIGQGGRYILASANTLPHYVKPENVRAMGEALLEYGFYSPNAVSSEEGQELPKERAPLNHFSVHKESAEIRTLEKEVDVEEERAPVHTESGHLQNIRNAIVNGVRGEINELVSKALDAGISPAKIIDDAMISAMEHIGANYSLGKIFVPEMLLAAMTMKTGLELMKPLIQRGKYINKARILLLTVKGDLHDIGKNLVGMMMEGTGFQVIDIGVNVDENHIIEQVRQVKPDIIAMSALLTTTLNEMRSVIQRLEKEGLREQVKVIVGGAPVTAEFAKKIGADGFGADAAEGADTARRLMAS